MLAKRLSSGATAYYWSPHARDIANGFTGRREALGDEYGTAKLRADLLNLHLDDWRHGIDAERSLDLHVGRGTLEWVIEQYTRSAAWERVAPNNQKHYSYIMGLVLNLLTKSKRRVGSEPVSTIDARAADKIYERLQTGPRGRRLRVATMAIMRMAKAWDVVSRLYPQDVPERNPFRGVALQHGKRTSRPASREQAFALHQALIDAGELHLAALPLICFEWHQRPENVLAGSLAWGDWRPRDRECYVRIEHAKTGEELFQPLHDDVDGSLLFPELTDYLDNLERLGTIVIMMRPQRRRRDKVDRLTFSPPTLFKLREARARVRDAAREAGLPDWLTLAACRHGGMTELGDAGATEAEVMASSGHRTPDAARLYVKRTDAQRMSAARKRVALRKNKQS